MDHRRGVLSRPVSRRGGLLKTVLVLLLPGDQARVLRLTVQYQIVENAAD